jgi:cytochrome P450
MGKAVIDFDHHSLEYGANATEIDRKLRKECPVAWTDHHGGFWLVTSYQHASTVLRDWETYSNAKYVDETGEIHGGVTIPANPELTTYPDEVDPPLWRDYRSPNSKLFAPAAIERRHGRIEASPPSSSTA